MRVVRSQNAQLWRDIALSALALVSVSIALYQLSLPDHQATRMTWLDWLDLGIVALFWADFVIELRRQDRPWRYVRRHWWELPSLVPAVPAVVAVFPAAGLLRALRLLRLVRVVSVLMRLRPAGAYVVRVARRAHLAVIFGVAAGIVLLGTLLVYVVEARANPGVVTLGGSLWFTLNMVTNGAYIDYRPVTRAGYAVAAFLQVCGLAFVGVFTASLAGAIAREDPDAE